MQVFRSCSWCHHMNVSTDRYCTECGHEAHVSRLECQCQRCRHRPDPTIPCAGCGRETFLRELKPVLSPPDETGRQLGRFLCADCLPSGTIIVQIDTLELEGEH